MNTALRTAARTLSAIGIGAAAIGQAALAADRTGYADVNGLHMYYEITGTGDPVVVLHGAYMSAAQMAPVTEGLARSFQVIAVDLQAHGRTNDTDRPLNYDAMADDVEALMQAIDVGQADVFGYSMGGGVALHLALRHPERVRKLAVASASFNGDGLYPELTEMMKTITPEMFAGTPWETAYKQQAPNPDAFPTLVEKLVALDSVPDNLDEQALRDLKSPMLVIAGDADIVKPEHAVALYRLRGGGPSADFMSAPASELAILPGSSHLGVMAKAGIVAEFVTDFFKRQNPRTGLRDRHAESGVKAIP